MTSYPQQNVVVNTYIRPLRLHRWVSRALDAFVSGLDVEANGVAEAVFGFCLDNLTDKRVGASVKATLFDKVCLPMVRRCPVEVSKNLYLSPTVGANFRPISMGRAVEGSVLESLLAVVKKRSKAGAFSDGPLVASCCFSLIEALYDMFDLKPLQAIADDAFRESDQASKGKAGDEQGLALRGVTLGIVSAWKAVCTSENKFDRDWRELRCRRAVFSCLCMVVRSTQDKEKLFDKLLWSDPLFDKPSAEVAAAGDRTSVLALVLDMKKEYEFEVSPPFFPTTRLRPPRPPPLGARQNTGSTSARGRNRGMTASSMLSQSSLGFGGDSLAAAGGGWDSSSNTGDGDGDPTEDARETYSSQAALTDPDGVPEEDGGSRTDSETPRSQSQSQSYMTPVFGRGASNAIENFRGRGGPRGEDVDEKDTEGLVLEMSHVNKEPCMRSLLLVVQTEERLFGEDWLDKAEQSNGV